LIEPMTENEMKGFATTLRHSLNVTNPEARRKTVIRAVVEHYLEKHLFRDMATEFGMRIADGLVQRMFLFPASLTDKAICRMVVKAFFKGGNVPQINNRECVKLANNLSTFIQVALNELMDMTCRYATKTGCSLRYNSREECGMKGVSCPMPEKAKP